MNARLIEAASVTLPLTNNTLDAPTLLQIDAVREVLLQSLGQIRAQLRS